MQRLFPGTKSSGENRTLRRQRFTANRQWAEKRWLENWVPNTPCPHICFCYTHPGIHDDFKWVSFLIDTSSTFLSSKLGLAGWVKQTVTSMPHPEPSMSQCHTLNEVQETPAEDCHRKKMGSSAGKSNSFSAIGILGNNLALCFSQRLPPEIPLMLANPN